MGQYHHRVPKKYTIRKDFGLNFPFVFFHVINNKHSGTI